MVKFTIFIAVISGFFGLVRAITTEMGLKLPNFYEIEKENILLLHYIIIVSTILNCFYLIGSILLFTREKLAFIVFFFISIIDILVTLMRIYVYENYFHFEASLNLFLSSISLVFSISLLLIFSFKSKYFKY